jgi:hypothetical protein
MEGAGAFQGPESIPHDGTSFPLTLKQTDTGEEWANFTTASPMGFPILSGVTLPRARESKGARSQFVRAMWRPATPTTGI